MHPAGVPSFEHLSMSHRSALLHYLHGDHDSATDPRTSMGTLTSTAGVAAPQFSLLNSELQPSQYCYHQENILSRELETT
jgi:hypothetical protein